MLIFDFAPSIFSRMQFPLETDLVKLNLLITLIPIPPLLLDLFRLSIHRAFSELNRSKVISHSVYVQSIRIEETSS